jgi:phosphohistidine phosphatase SixA
MTAARLSTGLATVLCIALSTLTPAKADTAATWQALADGAIVLFRHAEAPGSGDPKSFKLGDCSTQRNLSAAGRTQSRRIGEAFRARKIPVARVLTSQWCRCVDTAELAFPGQVVPEPAFNSFFRNFDREAEQTKQARAVLAAWTGPGTLVVVTHMVNITALTGVDPDEGEGLILRVVDGKLKQIGRIVP